MATGEDTGKGFAMRGLRRRGLAARALLARGFAGGAGTRAGAETGAETATSGLLLGLFIVTLIFPIFFHLGDLRLSPVRVFLLILIVPLSLRLLAGKAGKLRLADLFIGLHCLWIGLSLVINDGMVRVPFAGITVVELGGGYLVGRVLVRNRVDYRIFLGTYLATLVFLLPFALIEFVTDRQYLQIFADRIADTFSKPSSSHPRMGFHRTMAGFEHPILYGLYSSLAVGHVLYLWQRELWQRLVLVGIVSMMAFLSLSSAPLLAIGMQLGLAAWDRISGAKWKLALLLAIVGYVIVDFLSNRTPIEVIISYMTFSEATGYTRILIFQYGIESVWANPVFGIALNDWPRPHWLTSSVDNFWLLTAMRYGIPSLVFILLGIVFGMRDIITARNVSPEILSFRIGYLISLGGVMLTLVTVHMWGAVSVFVMMLMGAGMWFADAGRPEGAGADAHDAGADTEAPRAALPYSRGRKDDKDARATAAPAPKAPLPYSRRAVAPPTAPPTAPGEPGRPRPAYSRKPPQ